jgi:uncharacterized protein (TIGR03437 family)
VRTYIRLSLLFAIGCVGYLRAQSLTLVSGNGQVVESQFLSNLPLVVEATNASGQPAAGVAVSWKITSGAGTLVRSENTTDANGQASVLFLATNVQGGESFFASTVTASAVSGTVNFVVTTSGLPNGGTAVPPVVQLVSPPQSNLNLSGPSGSTVAGGVVVSVFAQTGPQTGDPVPNVSVRIANNLDQTSASPAACNGPNGVVLTNSNGTATCNLVISGAAGSYQLTAVVGEYQDTTPFTLTVTPGVPCSFSLSSNAQTFQASGGSSTVNVTTTSGCGWTATSNAGFITVTSGASGTGNGVVGFSTTANTGAARSGTLTIAGQTYTVNQSAGTPGSIAITTPPLLAPGNVGSTYSVTLAATGGKPPYAWSLSGSLPPGLTLNGSQGLISGTPTIPGTFGFTLTVTDTASVSQSQDFSILISPASTSGLTITNTSFPPGVVGQAYQQLLTSSGGCVTPFSPSPAFRVSGGSLPTGLSIQTNPDLSRSIVGTPLSNGTFNFTLTATDACGNSASASFSITIGGAAGSAQMIVSPASISFTVQAGTSNTPAAQTITISSTTSAVLNYTATATTQGGGSWLTIQGVTTGNTAGSTPGTVTVGLANFTSLSPGSYNGSITINSQASNSPVVVQVSLTVLLVPALTVNPSSFTINQVGSNGITVARQIIVVNSSPQVMYSATASTQSGGPWLSVDSSTVQGSTPGQVIAIINGAGLAAGTYIGTISITPVGGTPQKVTITLVVAPPAVIVATPAPLLFTAQQGGSLPPSQTLSLGTTGAQLDLTIGAGTQSGGPWLSVSPSTVTTPTNINVSVNPAGLPPASYQGTLNISASDPSVAPLTVAVTLTVTAPAPAIGSITSAASFAPGPVAPGEFVTIFGTSIGPNTPANLQLTPSGTVDSNLGGTEVFFDNIAAPVIYSSATQVSVIVPYEVAGRVSATVMVEYQGIASLTDTVRVIDSSPAIFIANASGQGAILNQDGSANSVKNGAAAGSVVSIFATGEGQTDPAGMDGVINAKTLPVPKPVLPVTAEINGEMAEVTYAGGAPGEVTGMLQVNVRIPSDVPSGTSVSVTITVGVATSQAGVTVAIK